MARFDFNSFPDRFTIEAKARRLRAEELGRLSHAVRNWLRTWSGDTASANRWGVTQVSHTRSEVLH